MFEETKQGDVLVLLSKEKLKTIKYVLQKNGKVIQKGKGFTLKLDNEHEVSMILVGTNSNYTSGVYKVLINSSSVFEPSKIKTQSFTFNLKKGEFVEEVIHFGKRSTSLIKDVSTERKKESAILTKVIINFDKNANYLDGYFKQPLNYVYYTSSYGTARVNKYIDGSRSRSVHEAIDYRAKIGTPLLAPADGKVVFASKRILTGFTVVLEHLPGVYSMFYHLSKLSVKKGLLVKKGEKLGETGASGFVTGPHLHWELRVNVTQVNPLFFTKNNIVNRKKILALIK